jgi:hypothetical protein
MAASAFRPLYAVSASLQKNTFGSPPVATIKSKKFRQGGRLLAAPFGNKFEKPWRAATKSKSASVVISKFA